MPEETALFDMISEHLCEGRGFLESEHTLRHFKELWSPRLFLRQTPDALWDGSEAAILNRCNEQVKVNLTRYQPPEWPREIIRALDELLARAKRELS